jgi:DNA-binding phage protein
MAKKTGFERWAATKMKQPSFAKSYQAARKRITAVDGLVRALDQIREESGISKAELARAIDAKPEILRRLFTKEGANPTLQTVIDIATALGLELRLVPIRKTAKKSSAARGSRAGEQRAVA